MAESPVKPLIVFEMANNHNGDVSHGVEVIEAFSRVAEEFRQHFRFGFKLQYRDLDTYIHASAERAGYVKRFLDTRLTRAEFKLLVHAIKENGFHAICTPFDEVSVAHAVEDGIEYLKIASANLGDWPLMEAVAGAGLPVIASTGGSSVSKIWDVAAFFRHRSVPLTLLHCVAEYPTNDERLNLRQIESLRALHPSLGIGFSTHESPDNTQSLGLALALGASVIEKHVGVGNLNKYSASPEQARSWLSAGAVALDMLGSANRTTSVAEQLSIMALRRGVFAKRDIAHGSRITKDDVEFAFPPQTGQLTANEWSKYVMHTAAHPIAAGNPVMRVDLTTEDMHDTLHKIARQVYEMVVASRVVVPESAKREISHHYGLSEFENFGLAMFTLVNREYCKKILLMLPGQNHPEQYHNQKEETFVLLHGDMELTLDGQQRHVGVGDVVTINPGVRHAFSTENGVVFEEISTTHDVADSFYTDAKINGNANRKTFITHWTNS